MKYALIACLALAALLGLQTYRLSEAQSSHNAYVAQIEGEARIASEKARQIEQARQDEIARITADAKKQKAIDDAAAAELVAAGNGLRNQITGLLADKSSLGARLAARGKTIGDLADLLAKLREEADSYAGELASRLDESRRAGFACERAYDSLRGSK